MLGTMQSCYKNPQAAHQWYWQYLVKPKLNFPQEPGILLHIPTVNPAPLNTSAEVIPDSVNTSLTFEYTQFWHLLSFFTQKYPSL